MQGNRRNTSIEVLRVLSMMMIITLHILSHGRLSDSISFASANYFVTNILRSLSDMGVNCFILISSYFISDMKFSYKRIVKIEIEVMFYSLLGLAVYSITNGFDIKRIIMSITPFISGEYWFVTQYIVVLLLSPFLNTLIDNLTQKLFKMLIILTVFLFSVVPSVFVWSKSFFSHGNDIVWFLTLYLIGAYIKKNSINYNPKLLVSVMLCLATVVIEYLFIQICIYLGQGSNHRFLYYNNNPLFLLASINLFILFKNQFIKNSIVESIVIWLSKCSFGVYLIHDNPSIRQIVWAVVKPTSFLDSNNSLLLLIYIFAAIISIYMTCSIIDSLRQLLFKVLKIDNLANRIGCVFQSIAQKVR